MSIRHAPRVHDLASFAAISPAAWYYLGLLAMVLLLAIASYWAYKVWSDVHIAEEPTTPDELMEAFEEARAAGELDDEEYARVRERIQGPGTGPPPTRKRGSAG